MPFGVPHVLADLCHLSVGDHSSAGHGCGGLHEDDQQALERGLIDEVRPQNGHTVVQLVQLVSSALPRAVLIRSVTYPSPRRSQRRRGQGPIRWRWGESNCRRRDLVGPGQRESHLFMGVCE